VKRLNVSRLNEMAKAAQRGEEFVPGCTGKKAYFTRQKGSDAILARKQQGVNRKLSLYRCKHCHKWHITSHPK
jgi:hypothetical protein